MSCESCDRGHVVKAYCFFVHRQEYFLYVYGRSFSLTSFADYAIEMDLFWKTWVSCIGLSLTESRAYWKQIEPYLKKALQESKLLKGN